MIRQFIIPLLIFLFCVCLPTWVLSFFPNPCGGGYGLCLLVFYPIIFLIGLVSGFFFYKFSNKLKFKKWLQLALVLIADILLIIYFYPKGEFSPFYQIPQAKKVANIYQELKPTDIFEATEKRNFNLITALYHKYNLPKEIYEVTYCLFDTLGSCDTTIKTFNYFLLDNKVFTNNSSIHFVVDLTRGSLTFIDSVERTKIYFKVGYPNFGKYEKDFDNTSSELTDKDSKITRLSKDYGNLRVMTKENLPKFEYKFEQLFYKYLDRIK